MGKIHNFEALSRVISLLKCFVRKGEALSQLNHPDHKSLHRSSRITRFRNFVLTNTWRASCPPNPLQYGSQYQPLILERWVWTISNLYLLLDDRIINPNNGTPLHLVKLGLYYLQTASRFEGETKSPPHCH